MFLMASHLAMSLHVSLGCIFRILEIESVGNCECGNKTVDV